MEPCTLKYEIVPRALRFSTAGQDVRKLLADRSLCLMREGEGEGNMLHGLE